MTLIVNIFGGPGIGKSTTAAGVFHQLKLQQVNCELVTEYAKEKVWDESFKVLDNQIYVFAHQHHRMFRCINKVDVIVTDSPINLGLVYGNLYKQAMSEQLRELIKYEFNRHDNLNIVLDRAVPYDETGRVQTEEEAVAVDKAIIETLDCDNHPYDMTPSCPHAADYIFKLVMERLNDK